MYCSVHWRWFLRFILQKNTLVVTPCGRFSKMESLKTGAGTIFLGSGLKKCDLFASQTLTQWTSPYG